MSTVFILHGSYGHPEENWFPWLKNKLEKSGYQVFVPQFPVPEVPNPAYGGHDLNQWFKRLDTYNQYFDNNTILVGHSRGAIFALRILEKITLPIKATFLVAPWIKYHWYPKDWTETDSFHTAPFNWEKIKRGSHHFEIYQSTNDDTPVDEGREIAQKVGGTLHLVKNAGHFNTKSGYTKFNELYENLHTLF